MRRFLAILLVAFFGFGPLAATIGATDDVRLPVCCRRNGAHHCVMSAAMRAWMLRAESRTPGFSAPSTCPLYPGFLSLPAAPAHALPPNAAEFAAPAAPSALFVHFRTRPRSQSQTVLAVRGPPRSPIA